ncbi:hypothetical protein Efla_001064 [Eimeria flavescens]
MSLTSSAEQQNDDGWSNPLWNGPTGPDREAHGKICRRRVRKASKNAAFAVLVSVLTFVSVAIFCYRAFWPRVGHVKPGRLLASGGSGQAGGAEDAEDHLTLSSCINSQKEVSNGRRPQGSLPDSEQSLVGLLDYIHQEAAAFESDSFENFHSRLPGAESLSEAVSSALSGYLPGEATRSGGYVPPYGPSDFAYQGALWPATSPAWPHRTLRHQHFGSSSSSSPPEIPTFHSLSSLSDPGRPESGASAFRAPSAFRAVPKVGYSQWPHAAPPDNQTWNNMPLNQPPHIAQWPQQMSPNAAAQAGPAQAALPGALPSDYNRGMDASSGLAHQSAWSQTTPKVVDAGRLAFLPSQIVNEALPSESEASRPRFQAISTQNFLAALTMKKQQQGQTEASQGQKRRAEYTGDDNDPDGVQRATEPKLQKLSENSALHSAQSQDQAGCQSESALIDSNSDESPVSSPELDVTGESPPATPEAVAPSPGKTTTAKGFIHVSLASGTVLTIYHPPPQTPRSMHAFYRLPTLLPGIIQRGFSASDVLSPFTRARSISECLKSYRIMMLKDILKPDQTQHLIFVAEHIVRFLLRRQTRSALPYYPADAADMLGRRFLCFEALLCMTQLFGPAMNPHAWWDRLMNLVPSDYALRSSRLINHRSVVFSRLALELSEGINLMKKGQRLPPDATIELKRKLFITAPPPEFRRRRWDLWRMDDEELGHFTWRNEIFCQQADAAELSVDGGAHSSRGTEGNVMDKALNHEVSGSGAQVDE